MGNLELLERAFSLADSGEVSNIVELRQTLIAEGLTMGELQQFHGRHLSKQLSARIASSRRKNKPAPARDTAQGHRPAG